MAELHGGGLRAVATQALDRVFDAATSRYVADYEIFLLDGPIEAEALEPAAERRARLQVQGALDSHGRVEFTLRANPAAEKALATTPAGANRSTDRPGKLPRKSPTARHCPGLRFYSRLIDPVPPASLPASGLLDALAKEMKRIATRTATSYLPAAYTYLGQFLAHDITHTRGNADDPLCPLNLRSHAFDLDSLFRWGRDRSEPPDNALCADSLCLEPTRKADGAGRFEDLARGPAGIPHLPDKRNDNNLAVAQLTVAMIRFHHHVVSLFPSVDRNAARTITRQHVQAVVLTDYLKRLIDPDIYCEVMERGRAVVHAGLPPSLFQIPIEPDSKSTTDKVSMRHQGDRGCVPRLNPVARRRVTVGRRAVDITCSG